jgi:hypothetical protein
LSSSGQDRALGVVHIVHAVNLASYMGRAAEAIGRTLGRVGVRPLQMDIAFCELPLLHIPGLLVAPDATKEERLALQEALITAARRTLDADLLVTRVASESPESRALGLPNVPFYDNHVMPSPGARFGEWLAGRHRRNQRKARNRVAARGASLRFHEGAFPPSAVLGNLHEETLGRNQSEVRHPIAMTTGLLDAIAALPQTFRALCTLEMNDEVIAFGLGVNAGPAALMRTAGFNRERSSPLLGYDAILGKSVELASHWGCSEVDLGPTAAEQKRRLGAAPRSYSYLVDFRRWWLRPARWLLKQPTSQPSPPAVVSAISGSD